MRSNRPNYASAPAGSSRALDRKPRPRRPKKEWNQLLLMLFFVVLPVGGLPGADVVCACVSFPGPHDRFGRVWLASGVHAGNCPE